jgi:formate dehydrogenase maturation protein FdhE
MDSSYLLLFAFAALLIALLIWMLFSLGQQSAREPENPVRGYCPLCGQGLRKGEKIRSSVVEIGSVEVQTRIKGCPFCLGEQGRKKRSCPVCKKEVGLDDVILALADPRVDKKKLSIKGCKNCYPPGF